MEYQQSESFSRLYCEQSPTLVIDTSYGLTVGIVGHEPLHDADSRSHVENIEPFIAQCIQQAGLQPSDIATIIVGTGPAPFTGLRAGIVSAKAFSYATGAKLIGQNILEPQAWWVLEKNGNNKNNKTVKNHNNNASFATQPQLVLSVNDARRKQLYYQLFVIHPDNNGLASPVESLTSMNIAAPSEIVSVVKQQIQNTQYQGYPLTIVGHGTEKYSTFWHQFDDCEFSSITCNDNSVVHSGVKGLAIFAQTALNAANSGKPMPADPLYLRRPEVELPPALKHVTSPSSENKSQKK